MSQFIQTIFEHLLIHWGIALVTIPSITYPTPVPISSTVKMVLLNQLISVPIFYYTGEYPEGSLFVLENLYKIPILLFLYEILFFSVHLFAHKYLYNIHKYHHLWNFPVPLATFYCHPLEHIFANILPLIISAKLAGLNFGTFRVWHLYALLNTMLASHNTTKKGESITDPHLKHHFYRNCNYGALGFMDKLHGSYR